MHLGSLLAEAIEAAPIDVRRDLLRNVIVCGGRWGGWPKLREHLCAQLDEWLLRRRASQPTMRDGQANPMMAKVIHPPEAGASAWIGGSILGSLSVVSVRAGSQLASTPPLVRRPSSIPFP